MSWEEVKPSRLLYQAVQARDLAAVNDVLVGYPGQWQLGSTDDECEPGHALTLCIIDRFSAGALRLLRDDRCRPGRNNLPLLAAAQHQIEVLRYLLPVLPTERLEVTLRQAFQQFTLDPDPMGNAAVLQLLLRQRPSLATVPGSDILLVLNEECGPVWWATLAAGPAVWNSHPLVPVASYQQRQRQLRACLTAAVGRNLAGYLEQAW